jgi:HK97 gp10 family phage protein
VSRNVKVEVIGISQAISNLEAYMFRKKHALLGVVAEVSQDVQSTARQLAPADLGNLKNEISYTVIEKKNTITGNVLSGSGYSAFVEHGTRPHRPPARALAGWAARHGVPLGAVLNSIAIKGTPAQPFMTPAAMKAKPKLIRACRRVMSTP